MFDRLTGKPKNKTCDSLGEAVYIGLFFYFQAQVNKLIVIIIVN